MPKVTFYNLPLSKQNRIEKAILDEFLNVSYDIASIKNIVNSADIPRGSFYQYFDDKEDAFKYIVTQHIKYTKNHLDNCLSTHDIFELIERVFLKELDFTKIQKNSIKTQLFNQISKSAYAMNLFTETITNSLCKEQWFIDKLNELNLCCDYYDSIIELLVLTLKSSLKKLLSDKNNSALAHESLVKKLTIIKRGICN